jgi:GNAT superfamily N-acetyltransferase
MALTPDLTGRAALLDLLDYHPYARLTAGGDPVLGYQRDGAVVWTAQGPWGPVAASMGDQHAAARLFAELADVGALDQVKWLHLPRIELTEAQALLPVTYHDHWDYLWTTVAPPPLPVEDDLPTGVVALDSDADRAAIEAVLDDALPHSTSRPGDPRIRAWHGIHDGAELIAVAGDRSAHGVGFLAGIAVRADRQGRGLGAAITAALTRQLITEYDVCSLGVMSDNATAIRTYQRLGYTRRIERSSVGLQD